MLTNIILFLTPEEAIVTLKLQFVNRPFRRAIEEVAPYQLRSIEAEHRSLRRVVQQISERREMFLPEPKEVKKRISYVPKRTSVSVALKAYYQKKPTWAKTVMLAILLFDS